MPLSKDQRDTLNAAMEASGAKFKYLILGPGGRTLVVADVADFMDWAMDNGDGRISVHVADDYVGNTRVSTVFLSTLVSGFNEAALQCPFETMVFGGNNDVLLTKKYLSWEEAEKGHEQILARVRALQPSAI
jgi:hypothetical protein